MKQIKTLTVNGVTYEIADPDAACIDDTKVGADAWSAKHIIDRLCPAFSQSGPAVTCQPVEGYPLSAVSSIETAADTLHLWHGGKNILDISTAGVYHNNPSKQHTDMYVTETGIYLERLIANESNWTVWGFCLGKIKELAGKTITVSARSFSNVEHIKTTPPWVRVMTTSVEPTTVREKPQYNDGGYIGTTDATKTLAESGHNDGYATVTYTVTGNEQFPYIGICFQMSYGGAVAVGDWTQWSDIQVEIGDAATEYEPYRGKTLEVSLGKTVQSGSYDWVAGVLTDETGETTQLTPAEITALSGVNTLMSYEGDVTVSGRQDLPSLLDALTS